MERLDSCLGVWNSQRKRNGRIFFLLFRMFLTVVTVVYLWRQANVFHDRSLRNPELSSEMLSANYSQQQPKADIVALSDEATSHSSAVLIAPEPFTLEESIRSDQNSLASGNNNTDKTEAFLDSERVHQQVPEEETEVEESPRSLLIPEIPDRAAADRLRDQVYRNETANHTWSPFDNCNPTVQVQIDVLSMGSPNYHAVASEDTILLEGHDDSNNSNNEGALVWVMYALDEFGNRKTVGGDEFYVTYTDNHSYLPTTTKNAFTTVDLPSSLVAVVDDRGDGSYLLHFVITPLQGPGSRDLENWQGNGTVTVHFQYTCGVGFLPTESKRHWQTGASTRVVHSIRNVRMPPFRKFTPPNRGRGDAIIDLDRYKKVIAVGDSLMRQFSKQYAVGLTDILGSGGIVAMKNIIYYGNVESHLDLETIPKLLKTINDWHGADLSKANDLNNTIPVDPLVNNSDQSLDGDDSRMPERQIAILLGSAVWDISLGPSSAENLFGTHLEACREYIRAIKELYPNIDIFWKSPTAIHIHRPEGKCYSKQSCVDRIRYYSESRSRYLYLRQKAIMKELQVPFLDLYLATFLSADYTWWGDAAHYQGQVSGLVKSWFYPSAVAHALSTINSTARS